MDRGVDEQQMTDEQRARVLEAAVALVRAVDGKVFLAPTIARWARENGMWVDDVMVEQPPIGVLHVEPRAT